MNSLDRRRVPEGASSDPIGRSTPYAVILVVTWLLLGPRLPLANIAGSSVRLEDALLLGLWVFVLSRWKKDYSTLPRRGVTAIVVVALLAAAMGVIAGRVDAGPSVLYSLRTLEYWAVFPAMYFVLRLGTEKHKKYFIGVLRMVTVVQVGVAAAQVFLGLILASQNSPLSVALG